MTSRYNSTPASERAGIGGSRTAAALLAVVFAGASGCIAAESKVLEATEGCDELVEGNAASLDIDPQAKEFILASEEVAASIRTISDDVFVACSAMAYDLGATDTWSGYESMKDRISNDSDTGACDVALLRIDEHLNTASAADVDIRVAMAEGECHVEFDDQATCDAECAGNTTCEPGAIEARCEPGSISSICNGSCLAGAFCVGTAEVSANCEGSCQAMCEGQCAGKCYGVDGTITEGGACHGKCAARCLGKCSGECEVDASAGIACGAGVYCRGTCDGIMDSPACTTEFDPPQCDVDIGCYEACTARLATEAVCTPSTVTVIADVTASPELTPVVDTLNANLPKLVEAANAEGKLMATAGNRMAEAGQDLHGRIEDVDGKSLACVGTATSALSDAVDIITVSVEACLDIQTEVNVRAEEVPDESGEATAGAGTDA
jgi:hypothetical protein